MKNYVFMILFSIYALNGNAVSKSNKVAKHNLDSVINDTCDKKIVLLGEDSAHGSGKTMETKIEIVKRLIDECGFSSVLFESPVYEFSNYARLASKNAASEDQLAQSIGGLWSNAKPMIPFIAFLHNKSINGQIKIAGIDSQFGANQPFSQELLSAKLSKYLDKRKQQSCETELYQYLNWLYSKENPYNKETLLRIESCVSAMKSSSHEGLLANAENTTDQFMVDNFYKLLEFAKGNYFNLRDKAMAENVNWHLSNSTDNDKVIIWCATIHAAKTLSPLSVDRIPMGYYLKQIYEDKMISIGFSALSGQYGRTASKIKNIEPVAMEKNALSNSAESIKYLSNKDLKRLGSIKGQPIQYNNIKSVNWSSILDGIIVLRNEKPLENIR